MMRKFLASLCWVGILAGSALALTGAEYQEMLKDPGFVAADKALNQAWAEAKKVMPKAAFEELKEEQGAWVAKGRDTEAREFMKNGMAAPKAYALVTEMRMRVVQTAAEDAFLMGNPSGVQGFYVRKGKGGEDGSRSTTAPCPILRRRLRPFARPPREMRMWESCPARGA